MKQLSAVILSLFVPLLCQAERKLTVGVPYKIARIEALIQYHALIEAGLKEAGFKLVLTPISIKSTYEMLIAGDVDAISYDDLSNKTKRDQVVTTSFPLAHGKASAFFLKNGPVNETKLEKYRGAISHNNQVIVAEAEKKNLHFKITANPFECIQMVLEQKVDYCLTIKEVGLSAIASNPEAKEKIKESSQIFVDVPVYFSMKKSLKKDLPKIEAAFKKQLHGDLSKYPLIQASLNKSP